MERGKALSGGNISDDKGEDEDSSVSSNDEIEQNHSKGQDGVDVASAQESNTHLKRNKKEKAAKKRKAVSGENDL